MPEFIRYQSPTPNRRGLHSGVFALANGLSAAGRLTEAQERYRRTANDWFTAAYPYPPAEVFDRERNPYTACWFRSSAAHLLEPIPDYVATLLDPHAVAWERIESDDPGPILLWADDVQVVVAVEPVRRYFAHPAASDHPSV